MVEIIVKPFDTLSRDELYDIIQLRIAVFCVEQNCPYQDLDGKDKLAHHILLKKENIIIGTCRLLPSSVAYDAYCSIGRVVVSETERQHQYGKQLMKQAIHTCFELYNCNIKISAQLYLEKFYTELGFIKNSEMYLEDNIPHIAMILQKINDAKKNNG